MNWLLYLSGWYLGLLVVAFFAEKIFNELGIEAELARRLTFISWAMLWVWICWKFVK